MENQEKRTIEDVKKTITGYVKRRSRLSEKIMETEERLKESLAGIRDYGNDTHCKTWPVIAVMADNGITGAGAVKIPVEVAEVFFTKKLTAMKSELAEIDENLRRFEESINGKEGE
jgi:hypothetical protein